MFRNSSLSFISKGNGFEVKFYPAKMGEEAIGYRPYTWKVYQSSPHHQTLLAGHGMTESLQ
jgi:hypothetical protein